MTEQATRDLTTEGAIRSLADVELLEQVPLEQRNFAKSTFEGISLTANKYPENLAIRYIENGDTWRSEIESGEGSASVDITYAQLLEQLHRTANFFRSLGVGDTDVVSMILPNIPEAHFTLWAGEAAGIVNPINYMLEPDVIGEIVESAKCKVLVIMGQHSETDIIEKLPTIYRYAPCIEHIVTVGAFPDGIDLPDSVKVHEFSESIQSFNAKSLDFERHFDKDTIASLFHTGGTTGVPKLAQHSHWGEVFSCWALNSQAPGHIDCYLTGLPVFHVNAAIASGLAVFMAGGTVLLAGISGYRSPGILANLYHMIDHFKVAKISGVPTIYSVLAQIPVGDCDLSSIRYAACGAAPMPVELFNTIKSQTGMAMVEGYGLTESTVCVTVTPPGCEEPRVGSIGVRLPYTQVRAMIIDEQFEFVRFCETDEVGTIAVSGPTVIPGYTDTSKNEELFVFDNEGQKWLNTGDLARQDNDGYFWLTGRAKELIIRGGHNIDPKTIEETLAKHPAVNLAAAVGRPDSYAGEIPVAYVSVVAETTEQALLEYCQENIGERAAIPKAIIIVDALPVTGVGKIHKPTLHLREIEVVVNQELADFSSLISKADVQAVADKKLGNIAEVKLVCINNDERESLQAKVKAALDAYSFTSMLDVE